MYIGTNIHASFGNISIFRLHVFSHIPVACCVWSVYLGEVSVHMLFVCVCACVRVCVYTYVCVVWCMCVFLCVFVVLHAEYSPVKVCIISL